MLIIAWLKASRIRRDDARLNDSAKESSVKLFEQF